MTVEPAPAWQQGHGLELLRALAQPFKVKHKALVFGAFGLTKELQVAEALTKKRLLWTGPQSAPQGCAIVHQLKRPSTRTDYSQRDVELPAGAVVVEAIAAYSMDAAHKLLQAVAQRSGARAVWVEAFEEDLVVRAALDILGFVYAATLVKAGSEVKGLYVLRGKAPAELPPEERATLTCIVDELLRPDELREVMAEVETFGESWAQHYSSYNKRKSWTSVALKGYDANDAGFIVKPAEMSRSWKEENAARMTATPAWTTAASALPRLRGLAEAIAPRTDRVRLMRLAAGGELSRHADITDREAGVADGRIMRLHVPLRTNPAVVFHSWSDRGEELSRSFAEGCLFYLDQRKPHRVANGGSVGRIHLVIDAWSTPELRRQLGAAHVRETLARR